MTPREHPHARAPFVATAAEAWFLERVGATAGAAEARARPVLVERSATARGAMPPLHARAEDETYYVVAGDVTFFVGDEVVQASSGDVVVAPSGVPRTYRVESDGARWLVLTRVASVTRFEDFGRAHAVPDRARLPRWSADADAAGVGAIAAANDISVLGPPGTFPADLPAR